MTRVEALRILGLEPDATPAEVKRAYRQLVKAVHPDKNSAPNARHLFQLVQEAYEFISAIEEQEQTWERVAREARDRAEREARARAARENAEREVRQRKERARAEKEARDKAEREKRAKEAREKQAKEELRKWEQLRKHAAEGVSGFLFFPGAILVTSLGGGTVAAANLFGFDLSWIHASLIPISIVVSLCKVNAWSKKYQLRRFYRNHPPPSAAGSGTQHAIPVTSFGEGFSLFFVSLLVVLGVFIMIDATVENRADLMDMESIAVVALAVITPIAVIGFAVIVLYDIVNWLNKNSWGRSKRKKPRPQEVEPKIRDNIKLD